jgi:phage gp29-like protein
MKDSKKASAAPVMNEVAASRDGLDITYGYILPNMPLLPRDTVLRMRGGAELSIYDQVYGDELVKATLQQRRSAVVRAEWTVEPGGDQAIDQEAADWLTGQLDAIDFDACTEKMLMGIFYGYAVAEAIYGRDRQYVTLEDLKVRNRRRFNFHGDGQLCLRTFDDPLGTPVPPKKFWVFQIGGADDDDPYGTGLGHWLYWPVFFKRNGIKFWMTFLDKYAMPTVIGRHPPSATAAEKNKLMEALTRIGTDSAIRVPEGMAVELLQIARSGTADYKELVAKMDDAITMAVLGQTLTSQGRSTGLGSGMAQMHMEVRQDLVKADADAVCQSFNRSIAAWLTEWNFPGAACPQVWRKIEDPLDVQAQSTADLNLTKMGFRPTLKRVQDIYGADYEDLGPSAMALGSAPSKAQGEQPPTEPTGKPPALSEAQANSPAETPFTGQLDAAAATVMDGLMEPVKKAVMQATSLEDLRARLRKLNPKLKPDEFANLMARAMAAAELAGRFSVQEEANAG